MDDGANMMFMREAIRLASENVETGVGGPFGAVIVKEGRIIATGTNKVTESNDPTAHAEVVAIRNACLELSSFQLEGCEIYCSCEPCPMCLGAIYWARPKKIYYACGKLDAAKNNFDDDFIYSEMSKPMGNRNLKAQQLLREEGLEVFKKWSDSEGKIKY